MTAPRLLHSIAEVRRFVDERRRTGASIALVPTLGALHEGHLSLVARASELADVVIVSIFVNPLQFGAGEDFARYPRTLDSDLAALEDRADAVFAPSVTEMYPDASPQTTIAGGPVAELFEGLARPGHFDGMLTVVAKLFNIVQPDVAVFGQKDAQQAFLVRRMVRDLDLPVAIEVAPTVREESGLALSSRNRYLSETEREAALALSQGLRLAASVAHRPSATPAEAASIARAEIASRPNVILDYLAIVDPASFTRVDDETARGALGETFRGEALAIVAARVGSTRLIDNQTITFS